MSRRAVYPGSFNPLTMAHVEIARAAAAQRSLGLVALAFSTVALTKETVDRPLLEHRIEVARAEAEGYPWLEVIVTDAQLIVDIAAGYDVVIMGADKWHQVNDPAFYDDDPSARDAALRALPELAIAPRDGLHLPPGAALLGLDHVADHSSTAARQGSFAQMTPSARAFDQLTGAWTDPDRYDRWLAGRD